MHIFTVDGPVLSNCMGYRTAEFQYFKRVRVCKLTVDLTYTFTYTEINDHSAILVLTFGQHVELLGGVWISRSEFPLKINSYPNPSRFWIDIYLIHWPKVPSAPGIEPA